jgi:hypothetical protein
MRRLASSSDPRVALLRVGSCVLASHSPGDVEAPAHTYCERGVSVQFNEYSGDNHEAAAVPFEGGALAFLTTRLAGQPASNRCSSIGAGNSLAPLPVPSSLRFAYGGPSRRLHGVVIKLWTTTGTLLHLVGSLRRKGS